ncbi:uncharacterized protein LOC143288898 [Babylonia areolata]|uniref:uncharacterized protein LOC143288898 n=1 Tax=Babylonia areolata TaxID=304850 RepID=UPI003FD03FAF
MRRGYTKTRVIFFNAPSAAHWGRPVPSRRRFHLSLCALALLAGFAFGMAVYVFNYTPRTRVPHWTTGERLRLTAVQSGDGLKITWYSALNTRDRLEAALASRKKEAVMLEADVSHRSYDATIPEKEQLMMSLGRDVKSDLSLEDWLDTVIAARRAGIKLNFMAADSVERALQLLRARSGDLEHVPVWLTVSVVTGPGGDGNLVDVSWVMRMVNGTYPRAQLVLAWSADCCGDEGVRFGRGTMESMLQVCQQIPQPIIVSAPATQAASQWRHFRWLLESSDRLSLYLWSPEDDKSWKNDTSYYDLLSVRNDWDKRRIFYNLPEARLQHFRRLAETAGSPLHHFDMRDRDAARVTWAHGANTADALAQAGREGAMMVEGDVSLHGLGTSRQTSVPVMAHRGVGHPRARLVGSGGGHQHHSNTNTNTNNNNSNNSSDTLTLNQWLDLMLTTNKAIKLDIKSSEAVVPALRVLAGRRSELRRPVWLNGDILRGPNALHDPMNTTHFLRSVGAIFPEVTLSLGWTSGWSEGQDNEPYSWEMVEKMEKVARKFRQPVTFAVRAVLARRSWDRFDWLLRQSRRYTLTLWAPVTSPDKIALSDLDFIRHQSERSRVYFDVPPDVMPSL